LYFPNKSNLIKERTVCAVWIALQQLGNEGICVWDTVGKELLVTLVGVIL
jgi:hypothetical protein